MRISFLFAVIVIILVFFGVRGYLKGLVGILFGVVSWVFILVFVVVGGPSFDDMLRANTGIYEALYNYFCPPDTDIIRITLLSEISKVLSSAIVRVIAGVLALVIALMIVFIVRRILKETIDDNRFLGGASRVLGTAWGLVEGLIISWIILAACKAILTGTTEGELLSDIKDNALLNMLYEGNPIASLFL